MTMLDASTGHTGSAPPTADVPVVTKADLRRAAWGSSAGSALEYYDFALYSLASALVFGPLFFSRRKRRDRAGPQLCHLLHRLRRTPARRGVLRPSR